MIYRIILWLRHLCYDKGLRKVRLSPVPSVCVGNVTVGGTGKTPHAEMILRKLLGSAAWAHSGIAVLSRGYKRRSKGFQVVDPEGTASFYGDEPLQIARKFPSVKVAVDRNRVQGAARLAGAGTSVLVLDDAFQYRALKATLNVVLVDYNRPVFRDRLMPWGRLRDFPSRLQKADVVLVTKCPPYLDGQVREQWRAKLGLSPERQLFFTTIGYGAPEPVFPEADARYTYAQRVILVSGIANDAPLRSYLSDTYKIALRLSFPDHHRYGAADVKAIAAAVGAQPTACVVTTEKDAQRLREAPVVPQALRERLFYLPIQAQFLTPEEDEAFTDTLLSALGGKTLL